MILDDQQNYLCKYKWPFVNRQTMGRLLWLKKCKISDDNCGMSPGAASETVKQRMTSSGLFFISSWIHSCPLERGIGKRRAPIMYDRGPRSPTEWNPGEIPAAYVYANICTIDILSAEFSAALNVKYRRVGNASARLRVRQRPCWVLQGWVRTLPAAVIIFY